VDLARDSRKVLAAQENMEMSRDTKLNWLSLVLAASSVFMLLWVHNRSAHIHPLDYKARMFSVGFALFVGLPISFAIGVAGFFKSRRAAKWATIVFGILLFVVWFLSAVVLLPKS
jgi:hypothetical protein